MNIQQIAGMLQKVFPSAKVTEAIGKVQQQIQGVPDSLQGVGQAAQQLGINRAMVDRIYDQYGKSMQARAICGLFGTTPEALKADADAIVGGNRAMPISAPPQSGAGVTKFPRLK